MNRREFIALIGGTVAAWPFAAGAQSSGRMRRIGIFLNLASDDAEGQSRNAAFLQGLQDLGWSVGRNVRIDYRWGANNLDPNRIRKDAADLLALTPDIVLAATAPIVAALQQVSRTVPIAFVGVIDPVGAGLVASLARPGGNITGTTTLSVDLSIKQLELLKDAVPRASRIALLSNPDNPWHPLVVKGLRDGHRLGDIQLQMLEVRRPGDIDNAFQAMIRARAQGVLVLADPMTFAHRTRLAGLAVKYRLPLMGGPRGYAEAGALMCYWAAEDDLGRRVASYVDRVLKGASPAGLPIEQPTTYDLVVNLRTAKALALAIPSSLLLRATVIE